MSLETGKFYCEFVACNNQREEWNKYCKYHEEFIRDVREAMIEIEERIKELKQR